MEFKNVESLEELLKKADHTEERFRVELFVDMFVKKSEFVYNELDPDDDGAERFFTKEDMIQKVKQAVEEIIINQQADSVTVEGVSQGEMWAGNIEHAPFGKIS
jgi:hypothetical protein